MTPALPKRDQFLAALAQGPQVMGILNLTPDSFSDGGQHVGLAQAVARAQTMADEGAGIIDLGGESTRPGATPVSAEDELARVLPVLRALSGLSVPISIDSYKASVARAAVEAGACVINDVWGLQKDPDMAATVAETGAALVIMHNREAADPSLDIVADMERFFARSLSLAQAAGVPEAHIILDPGIGFGKSYAQNLAAINAIPRLRALGFPVLLGLSRKRMFGEMLGADVNARLYGTLAANLAGLARGAQIFRVHDVRPHVEALTTVTTLEAAR